MSRRFQHAATWIIVQTIFAFSGLAALVVGVSTARCDVDAQLLPGNNGPLGVGADGALYNAGRWALIVGMFAGIVAVVFGMYLSWKDQIRVRTLLVLMALSIAQFTVALAVWSVQVDSTPFCSFDAKAIATTVLMIALVAAAVAFATLRTAWSSAHMPTTHTTPHVSRRSATLAAIAADHDSTSDRPVPTPTVTRPLVIQLAGHGGAGKSTLARAMEERLDGIAIDLDVIKTKLLDGGATWDEASRQSYDTVYRLVDDLLTTSDPVIIVDTPSYWPEIHQRLTASADRHGAEYVFAECTASSDTRAARLAERTPMRSQAPDARTNPVDAPESQAPVHERDVARPTGRIRIVLDTEGDDIDANLDAVLSKLDLTTGP